MSTQTEMEAGVLAPGAGTGMSWFGETIMLKESHPGFGAAEVTISPGAEPPLHVHSREDEWFYVVEGELTFHIGDTTHRAPAGSFAKLPRGIPHTFTVESERARLLMLNSPGGFEHMFELAPSTPEEAMAAFAQYGIEAVGPHPRDA